MKKIPVFCGKDCGGDACPLIAEMKDGRVTRVTNNPAGGRFIKGCWRGFNLPLVQYAPDRLLKPLIRTGPRGSGQFREAGWEEALDLAAAKLGEIRAKYGCNAILDLASAGSSGALHNTAHLLSRFLNLSGGCTRLTGNYSNGAAMFILPYMLGDRWTESGFDAATLQYAEMIILWGANILETRMGSEVPQRLMQARQRGAQIVVIDPRRSVTAARTASWWLPCRPGTDAALMLAVLFVLTTEDLLDRHFIETHSAGFDKLERIVLGKEGGKPHSPQWAERICGLPADTITRFARAYAAAKPTMLFPGYSIQRVYAGEETYRLSIALQIATGNFGVKGGSTGSLNNRLPPPKVGQIGVPFIPDQPSLPVNLWPDLVLQGKGGGFPADIHAIYSMGGNFINQGSDIHKNIAAFEKVDFSICHELFLTPTARYCDIVFPAAAPLEKEDIGLPWLGSYLLYKPQLLTPRGQARSDYDILCDLAERLNFLPEFSEGRSAADWVQHFLNQSEIPDHDAFRETGIYLAPDQERVGLSDFSRNPLGFPLSTPSGKVEIASEKYQFDTGFSAVPCWQPPPEEPLYPLRLLTPKAPSRTHSQGSNISEIQVRAAHALEMHPQDAIRRGIADGDKVRLFNAQGAALIPVRLTVDLTPGVVCLPEGVWVELDQDGVDLAGSANIFTSTPGTAPGKACIMHAVAVEVGKKCVSPNK
jgi:anaerobic dimethyl sulfoxide reductase subunit A